MGLHSHNRHLRAIFVLQTTLRIFGFLLSPKETTESHKHMLSSSYLSFSIQTSEKLHRFPRNLRL